MIPYENGGLQKGMEILEMVTTRTIKYTFSFKNTL